jgi:acyl-CoA synthetase (AMP-forming)/AMP-acid ligase II
MDTRLETVITLFGIVRAGAVAVPLNVSINDAAIATMCADAELRRRVRLGASLRADRFTALLGRARCPSFHRLRIAGEGWRDFQAFIAGQSAAAPGGGDCAGR